MSSLQQSPIVAHFAQDVDLSTAASREDVRVKLELNVGDPTGKEYDMENYADIPRGVINAINAKGPRAVAVFRKLVLAICPDLQDELIFKRGPWCCHACRKPATKFTFNFNCYLHLQPPLLKDVMTRPICRNPECRVRTEQWCQNAFKEVAGMQDTRQQKKAMKLANSNEYGCANCMVKEDKRSGTTLQKCSRCKHVCYCSKDCQRKHWKEHKVRC